MTRKQLFLLAGSLLMFLVAACILYFNGKSSGGDSKNNAGLLKINLRSIQEKDGWGYDVLVDNKVFIHQNCIPAIPFQKRFVTEEEALMVGSKVIHKLEKGRLPCVTREELNIWRIHY